jgi:hypothetical protein
VTVAGFSFKVSTATADIDFTVANTSTTVAPYIFQGNSLAGPTISTTTGQSLIASDLPASGPGTTVGAGAEFGLGHLLFDVSSNTPSGPITVSFTPFPSTSLSDASGANIPINTPNSGTISVLSVIPEPSTFVLAIIGIPTVTWWAWRSRQRRKFA